jgi:excinuclease ABC subunit C
MLDYINQIYRLRTCRILLTPEKIATKKFRVCLEYHLGNCSAPCIGEQSREEYLEIIHSIREIIKGHIKDVLKTLHDSMIHFADLLEFEKAQDIKKKYEQLKQYQSKSVVVNPDLSDLDVFSISVTASDAIVNFMEVVQGFIVKSQIMELKKKLDESQEDLLGLAVIEMRQQGQSTANEIIVPFLPNADLPDISYVIPQRGDKFKLLELATRNVRTHQIAREKMQKMIDPEAHTKRLMETMKLDLRMNVAPTHIECFDNSNIQGAYPVAAMVVFRNGKPSKKDYRHFNIKTVEGPNDFASMEEIIYRRYHRLLQEKQELPQLIIIDGGKGQLSSAVNSLKTLNLYGVITIISIAKRLEEIYFPNDSIPIYIDKTSPTLKIIQQLRDEAHRFGITHHRNQRSKGALTESLTLIPGIGTKTTEALLRHAGSVKRIKAMSEEELSAIVGKAKAKMLLSYFQKTSGETRT